MTPAVPAFTFKEGDHLTRIHLKLGLEDLGFVVVEDAHTLHLFAAYAPPAHDADGARLRGDGSAL